MKYLVVFLSLFFPVSAVFANPCPAPDLSSELHLTLPCVGVNGAQYRADLDYLEGADGIPAWRLQTVGGSACAWDVKTCATVDEQLQLTVPGIPFNSATMTAILEFSPDPTVPGGLFWKYLSHAPSKTTRGKIDSHGMLLPYEVKKVTDGTGRKLLAIYMVGSNLESGSSQAATTDLFELIGGYRKLANPNLDVVVAFGGSTKDHWQGMKFADMPQLLEDGNDARFGNEQNYLYRSDHAHMGDGSSLKHFLNYLRDAYVNHDQRVLMFWDHGASYQGFGNDEVYNMEPLSLPEIRRALADSGQHFDLLGFDACLMASLETAKYTYPYADYLLASEDLEPGHGWNWTEVITAYATQTDIVSIGKRIIDNYIDNNSHAYRSSGKTLSLADLSRFPELETALLPLLNRLTAVLLAGDSQTTAILENILGKVRGYSNTYRISLDFKDLLAYLDSLSGDALLKEKISPLLDALDAYLVYARHDGSRPYSYGTTIDRLDNKPYEVSLNTLLSELQRAWQTLKTSDKGPPQLSGAGNKANLTGMNNVSAGELASLRAYIDSGALPAEALPWWEKAYLMMADALLTLDDKLKGIAALENDSGGIFSGQLIRSYYLNKGVEIVRVEIVDMPRGVEIVDTRRATRTAARDRAKRSEVDFIARPVAVGEAQANTTGISRSPVNLPVQAERAAFTAMPVPRLVPRSATALTLTGSVSGFQDDNPFKVTAVYGTIYYNQASGEPEDFDSFAELEAFPTQEPGKYFTYAWNRMWYTVKYSPEQSSLWLPLRFSERFRQDGVTYTAYTGEIYYRDWQSFYPEPAGGGGDANTICAAAGLIERHGKCFQQAVLEVYADESNSVVAQYVRPYQIVAGQAQFDKNTMRLKAGDEVWFLFDSFGLEPGATPLRLANTISNSVQFTQEPEFAVEMMSAVSAATLRPKKFYYAFRATDIAGNITISPPFLAKTPMPVCAKLSETYESFNLVLAELASAGQLIFTSPLGNALDQAASTVMVAAEAEENQAFSTAVEALYGTLYNPATLDRDTSDWVWGERVDWPQAKSGIETLLPGLNLLVRRECAAN